MALFLEGPDLAGKTTLAQSLCSSVPEARYSKAPCEGAQVFPRTYAQARLPWGVADRGWVTDQVYREVEGGVPSTTLSERWILALACERVGGAIALVCPSPEVLEQRYRERGDCLQPFDKLRALYGGYTYEVSWPATAPTIFAARGVGSVKKNAEHLAKWWVPRVRRALAVPWVHLTTGTLNEGCVLLVGDRNNPERCSRDIAPFVDRRRGSCSTYLYEMLHRHGFRPNEVHLTNAYSVSGELLNLRAVAEFLRPRSVVALGAAARAALTQAKLPYHSFPHPQWLRRFEAGHETYWSKRLPC